MTRAARFAAVLRAVADLLDSPPAPPAAAAPAAGSAVPPPLWAPAHVGPLELEGLALANMIRVRAVLQAALGPRTAAPEVPS